MARKTIRHAVKDLPREHAELIIEMFSASRVMDLYDGNLTQYLQVIAQCLREQHNIINVMRNASDTIRGILDANF